MQKQGAQLGDYLAGERTSRAWIRTGLAMMGFGFVVARFGLFLQGSRLCSTKGTSLWFGTALIAVGVAANQYTAWRHIALVRGLRRGEDAAVSPHWIKPHWLHFCSSSSEVRWPFPRC